MNTRCKKCSKTSLLLNGLYCNVVKHYIEHRTDIPCQSKQKGMPKDTCRKCIWKREMMFGIWCDLHRKDTKDIVKCESFDGGRNYDR